eukprot:gene7585-11613_t
MSIARQREGIVGTHGWRAEQTAKTSKHQFICAGSPTAVSYGERCDLLRPRGQTRAARHHHAADDGIPVAICDRHRMSRCMDCNTPKTRCASGHQNAANTTAARVKDAAGCRRSQNDDLPCAAAKGTTVPTNPPWPEEHDDDRTRPPGRQRKVSPDSNGLDIKAVLCWLVPSTLASFAADACVASGEVPTATQPQLAAVLCCRDGDWCDSDIGGRCHGDSVGFAEASDVCASRAARMCTFAELSSGLCCDTGCGYDDLAAWYDNCVSGPCVHGTCSSTAESYTCTCDAGFTGENCDEELPTTSTAEPSQTFAPTPEPEGSRGELFGAHSFDFLIEEADRFKNRMINRTADAASDVMDKLGLEDMLVSITENGVLADLQEQVTEKLDTVFGEFFEGNGTIDFDVDEILEPLKEQAGSVMKSCKASPLPADPQARSARAQGTDRLKAILKDVFVPDGTEFCREAYMQAPPAEWMRSETQPLYKKGNRHDLGNYRQITLASCCGKLYNAVLRGRIRQALRDQIGQVDS